MNFSPFSAGSRLVTLIALWMTITVTPSLAEDVLRLKNGSDIRGRITKETDKEVTIETGGIGMSFPRSDIKAVEKSGAKSPASTSLSMESDSDAPKKKSSLSAGKIEQGPLADLVAKVGPGGITRSEYDFYLLKYANHKAKKSVRKFTPEDRKAALNMGIEDELIFQDALADGILDDEYIRWRILQEYKSSQTTARIEPSTFGENAMLEYYKAHPDEFTEPASINPEALQFPKNTSDDALDEALEKARRNPDSAEWKQLAGWTWIRQTEKNPVMPQDVHDYLFTLKPGEISDIVEDDFGNFYIFRIRERKEERLLSFSEAEGKIRFAMVGQKDSEMKDELADQAKKSEGVSDAEEAIYRTALKAGAARTVDIRQAIINTHMKDSEGKREEILKELRLKFPVKILSETP